MSRKELIDLVKNTILIGDGAMGTMLQKLTGSPERLPELLVLKAPETILKYTNNM